jgi:hypothetical protein
VTVSPSSFRPNPVQLDAWFGKVNARTHKTLRARPVDRLAEDLGPRFTTGANIDSFVGAPMVGQQWLGQFATGRWIDFVCRIEWSGGNAGIREVWRDGVYRVATTDRRWASPRTSSSTEWATSRA